MTTKFMNIRSTVLESAISLGAERPTNENGEILKVTFQGRECG